MPTAPAPPSSPARERLLRALAAEIAARGWAQVTVAHVVARARTSRRTFYEHFADRDAALVALHDAAAEAALDALQAGAATPGPWRARLRAALGGWLAALAADPAGARMLLVEAPAVAALDRRRDLATRRAGATLAALLADGRREEPRLAGAPEPPLHALLAGVQELAAAHARVGRAGWLRELEGEATAFVLACTLGARAAAAAS